MSTITAAQVNELRQKTGVGMMDCKKALVASNGDMEAAIEHLRKAGMAKAEKKAGRAANQGIFVTLIEGNVGVMVEFLCETDFVAKTDLFQNFGAELAKRALRDFTADGDISAELAAACNDDLKDLIGKLGENMQVRRAARWVSNGRLGSYLHTGVAYGVLIDVEGECDDELLNSLCLHVTAFAPAYVKPEDVPPALLAKQDQQMAQRNLPEQTTMDQRTKKQPRKSRPTSEGEEIPALAGG